ncbi:Alpha/Beta hydrolase protein [Ephemerocybe angulata]|uniref:Alpha/Beta hydrolase protein n=1 Tax=Ephemerocybe angulata TaxID=980116 RepID=A0A8H6I6N8_9AGAR|nr:Alpha/Beta hydrolase protein [Tulosesus angulatus]
MTFLLLYSRKAEPYTDTTIMTSGTTTDSSPVLAGPIGDCCVQGIKHSGEPVGNTIEVAGVPTYLSEPPSHQSAGPKKVVLFFPDVFGPFHLNNQLLQDYYASQGFYVLGIDYFFGDPIYLHLNAPGWDRTAWLEKSRKQAADAVPKWIEEVQKTYGADSKYSAVGYCFGGPYVLDIASTDRVVAAAFAHPAYLTEDHFKKLTKPLLLSTAEVDHTFPAASRRRAVDILIEKKAIFHVQLFSGVEHGFGTKGDPDVENDRWAKEESARSIINWFIRFSKA